MWRSIQFWFCWDGRRTLRLAWSVGIDINRFHDLTHRHRVTFATTFCVSTEKKGHFFYHLINIQNIYKRPYWIKNKIIVQEKYLYTSDEDSLGITRQLTSKHMTLKRYHDVITTSKWRLLNVLCVLWLVKTHFIYSVNTREGTFETCSIVWNTYSTSADAGGVKNGWTVSVNL